MSYFKCIWFSFLLLFLKDCYGADDVCYKGLGCFKQTEPWVNADRPFPPPQSPEEMNVTITFFSRQEKKGQTFEIYPNVTFDESKGGYKKSRRVAVITHGFASSSSAQWVLDMKDAYLNAVDVNVFLVNWEKGASNTNYLQAASNARVVGEMLGLFGTNLFLVHKSSVRYHHMIGHCLGAHVSAYAAVGMNKRSAAGKILKITGLDPAQPGFQNQSTEVRLSPDKARFVEIVHSDAKPFLPSFGFGYLDNMGHADFYLNQGFSQPGCVDTVPIKDLKSIDQLGDISVEVISKAVACSHGRAHDIYTSAIDIRVPCKFVGHRVSKYLPITSNQSSCGSEGLDCLRLDIFSERMRIEGGFQIVTGKKKPYCCYNYSPVTGCQDTNVTLTTPSVSVPPVTPPASGPSTPSVPDLTTPSAPDLSTPSAPDLTTPSTPDLTTPSVPDLTTPPAVG